MVSTIRKRFEPGINFCLTDRGVFHKAAIFSLSLGLEFGDLMFKSRNPTNF